MTASVLTVTERVNTVTFDATLMEPATAYVAHLYDMEGLVFDHAGLQYFVEHYRTTALVEGCRVGWTRYGSITRLELVDQDDPPRTAPIGPGSSPNTAPCRGRRWSGRRGSISPVT